MNFKKEIQEIKKREALDKCFIQTYFDVCPINEIYIFSYLNRSILHKAHCVHFNKMSDEMIVELKSLTREAIYDKPWWKLF
jgi:hypothetical protein